jgi:dTDP-4-amino-4,6-dideoxygalactose transaminase
MTQYWNMSMPQSEKIQLFAPTFNIEECLFEIRKCLEAGWTGIGFKTIEFEDAWKKYATLPCAHFLNSNTAGLIIALNVFKEKHSWQDGDEVITTPLTFVSTNHAILHNRLQPVFADIDKTLCLDPDSVASRISKRTKAVMYVGFGGSPGRLSDIKALCAKHGLILILDAAHMAGTSHNGRHIGNDLPCTIFSFQAVKNLPTADSGMICFADPELDQLARQLSWLGINQDTYSRTKLKSGNYKWLYEVEHVGYKAHGNALTAALGLVQLRYLDAHNEYRRKLCALYENRLSLHKQIQFTQMVSDCTLSRHLFQIIVPQNLRNECIMFLNEHDIHPGVHYRVNTEYPMYRYALGTCPVAEELSQRLISLPLHMRLTESGVHRICDTLIDFLSR